MIYHRFNLIICVHVLGWRGGGGGKEGCILHENEKCVLWKRILYMMLCLLPGNFLGKSLLLSTLFI